MTQTIPGVEPLRAALAGVVVAPDDLDYGQARRVWNADIDHHPAVIAQCATAQDVAEQSASPKTRGWSSQSAAAPTAFPGTPQSTEAW